MGGNLRLKGMGSSNCGRKRRDSLDRYMLGPLTKSSYKGYLGAESCL